MRHLIVLLLAVLAVSCNSQESQQLQTPEFSEKSDPERIAEYVVMTFEDSKGHLWFGTLNAGVAMYDGQSLRYFTEADGLPSNRVVELIEDDEGILWFGTGKGISKFDGKTFTNFIDPDVPCSHSISLFTLDRNGNFWIGSWEGVCRFDGTSFEEFELPTPEIPPSINPDTRGWITEIQEDPDGGIWFARDGYGACKYDGSEFTFLLQSDGIHANTITELEFDQNNDLWVGTRVAERDLPDPKDRHGAGGVNKRVNGEFITFPEIPGFTDGDVYEIHADRSGNVWISTTKNGLYKYDGETFQHYDVPVSVMTITEDRSGVLWLGAAGGLYKLDVLGNVIEVTKDGPF